jgi:hypothetical protein
MNLRDWFASGGGGVTAAQVRAEIWSLGTRHHGWPLEGALDELANRDISNDRAALLRACVRKLQDQ